MSKFRSIIFVLVFCNSMLVKAQAPSIALQTFASGFVRPVDIENCKDSRMFIVEQDGYINIVKSNGVVVPTPFLDIDVKVGSANNEQGLLGLAFHPQYKQNGYFYVYYTNNAGNIVISRFTVSAADSNLANVNSELVLLTIPHPAHTNHNGGCIKFGADDYLYIGTGDGGGAGDTANNSQNLNKRLGKLMRIDVNNGTLYSIPPDNPYINNPNAFPEIWAHGLRNPWRYSFDRLTGDLWIGDVGQNLWEEVDFQEAGSPGGRNYGWRCYEGNHAFNTTACLPQSAYVAPVYEMSHSNNNLAITGGFVYRGAQYSNMFGCYFFSDYNNNMIQVLKDSAGVLKHYNTINFTNAGISVFGEDQFGELYVADHTGGIIKKFSSTVCSPTAFIAKADTIYACADSLELITPFGDGLFYAWQTPNSSGNEHSIWVNQNGWCTVTVINGAVCQNTDSVYVVLLGAPPVATITGLDTAYCTINASPVSLTGNPAGGVFTGDGIKGNLFYTDTAGKGIHVIKYIFTDANGCVSMASKTVHVSICSGVENAGSPVFKIIAANTATGRLMIKIESRFTGKAYSSVTDITGHSIYQEAVGLNSGTQIINIPMNNTGNGVYLWRLKSAESSVTYRFVWIK